MINEWNVSLRDMNDDPQFQPAFLLEATYGMKKAGLSYSNYYHIRDTYFFPELFLPFYEKKYVDEQLFFWNYRPQPLGLFDLQDRVRPAYFAFKLLARLTGDGIDVESSEESVRGLATHDAEIDAYNLLVWNYSDKPARVEIGLRNLPRELSGLRQELHGRGPSDDDIHRIRLLGSVSVDAAQPKLKADLGGYGIQYWTLR
jgi:hypothetical protein